MPMFDIYHMELCPYQDCNKHGLGRAIIAERVDGWAMVRWCLYCERDTCVTPIDEPYTCHYCGSRHLSSVASEYCCPGLKTVGEPKAYPGIHPHGTMSLSERGRLARLAVSRKNLVKPHKGHMWGYRKKADKCK